MVSFLFFNFWRFFNLRIVKLIFLFSFILSDYAGAQGGDDLFYLSDSKIFEDVSVSVPARNSDLPFNESITISSYMVEYVCSYGNDKGRDYRFINKNDSLAVEKYVIKLKSKHKMFVNYNNYYSFDGRVKIQSDLHEINPNVEFRSKADIEISLNGEQFDQLIQVDGFFVYYPMSVFDYRWVKKVSEKNNTNELWFSTGLSSVGFDQYKKRCHDTIESQRVKFEKENNKPINRVKNLLGV